MKTAILYGLLLIPFLTIAQNGYKWEERIYSPLIKSVVISPHGTEQTTPLLLLNAKEKLRIEFDELIEETKNYQFHLIHCNQDWIQSSLEIHEYLIGFESIPITNFRNSFNTIQQYVHYWEDFPNDMQQITQSGNYALVVTDTKNADQPVLVKHFMVLEPLTQPAIGVQLPNDPALQKTHQEVSVNVLFSDRFYINSPKELSVYLFQNNRIDNSRQLKHRVVQPTGIEYSWQVENIFNGGNEFRSFDFTSLRTRSQFVNNFDFIQNENHVLLKPEIDKHNRTYTNVGDLNGRYYIRSEFSQNPKWESDYAWIHFYFPASPRFDGYFYLNGAMTNYQMNDQSQMIYNFELKCYESAMYLKQGYYNYQILFRRMNETIGDETVVEGSHFETKNEYQVLVYHRKPGNQHDSLIGFGKR